MRLIDADSIRGCEKYIKINEDFDSYITIDDLAKLLDEQPIVYDIRNVVEELRRVSGNGYRDVDGDYVPPMIETKNAIKIVMYGGVRKELQ